VTDMDRIWQRLARYDDPEDTLPDLEPVPDLADDPPLDEPDPVRTGRHRAPASMRGRAVRAVVGVALVGAATAGAVLLAGVGDDGAPGVVPTDPPVEAEGPDVESPEVPPVARTSRSVPPTRAGSSAARTPSPRSTRPAPVRTVTVAPSPVPQITPVSPPEPPPSSGQQSDPPGGEPGPSGEVPGPSESPCTTEHDDQCPTGEG